MIWGYSSYSTHNRWAITGCSSPMKWYTFPVSEVGTDFVYLNATTPVFRKPWLNQFLILYFKVILYGYKKEKVFNSSFRVLFWELYTFYCLNFFQIFSHLIHITIKVTVGMCIGEMECEQIAFTQIYQTNQQFQCVRRSWVTSFTLPCVSGKTHWFWTWCSQTITICHPTLKTSRPKWQHSKWMPNEDKRSFFESGLLCGRNYAHVLVIVWEKHGGDAGMIQGSKQRRKEW